MAFVIRRLTTAIPRLPLQTDEIVNLAGCDFLTISPALLEKLAKSEEPIPRVLSPEQGASAYVPDSLLTLRADVSFLCLCSAQPPLPTVTTTRRCRSSTTRLRSAGRCSRTKWRSTSCTRVSLALGLPFRGLSEPRMSPRAYHRALYSFRYSRFCCRRQHVARHAHRQAQGLSARACVRVESPVTAVVWTEDLPRRNGSAVSDWLVGEASLGGRSFHALVRDKDTCFGFSPTLSFSSLSHRVDSTLGVLLGGVNRLLLFPDTNRKWNAFCNTDIYVTESMSTMRASTLLPCCVRSTFNCQER